MFRVGLRVIKNSELDIESLQDSLTLAVTHDGRYTKCTKTKIRTLSSALIPVIV